MQFEKVCLISNTTRSEIHPYADRENFDEQLILRKVLRKL